MIFKKSASTNAVLALIGASIAAAVATFLILSGRLAPFEQDAERILLLLLLDVLLLLALCAMITRHIGALWSVSRRGIPKSQLQRRIVFSFGLVTILPTVIVSAFSALFFNLGIQAWFNERVNTAVEESLAVAEAYLNEHKENIRVDTLALADDINRYAGLAIVNPIEFNRLVSAQASRRRLTEVVVFQGNRIIAQGRLSFTLAFESLPQNAIARAAEGEVVILANDGGEDDKVRALTRLEGLEDAFLMAGRLIDDKVISHMDNTTGAVNEYRSLKRQLTRLQWTFSAMFVMLTLVLVLASVWYGLTFATRLTTPITRLAAAAERVRAGDYSGRVEAGAEDDEMNMLLRTFNRMTEQLDQQRRELIEANRQLDARRRFSEAVLGGVSAGVIALDGERRVTLFNRSTATMLASPGQTLQQRHINELLPGIHELLIQAESTPGEPAQGTLALPFGAVTRTLHVRVVTEVHGGSIGGYIVTFDDITPLVAAQRNAAWSDVARRVAHEIKNPLTPIALSAERLRRKYLKMMEGEDAENFSKYVDTIARHVADIGRMVEEFVSFARMPGAVLKTADLVQIARRALFSEQVAHPSIRYHFITSHPQVEITCDERQIAQVLTNLLKNAAEAIEGQHSGPSAGAGDIHVRIEGSDEAVTLTVQDSGPGFPPDRIHTMLEPYVTTRAKGTGLGLAIVKRIIEEHGGSLQLSNVPEGGACVMLSFLPHCDIKAAAEDGEGKAEIA